MLGAAVVTVAVTATAVPLSCTLAFDKLHAGAGVTVGAMVQLRFTVPVKVPAGATAILNCAFCPGAIVCEDCDPEANPTVKSGGATATPESAMVCGLPGSVPLTAMLAILDPPFAGENITLIVQPPPAASDAPQLLVCVKSELS